MDASRNAGSPSPSRRPADRPGRRGALACAALLLAGAQVLASPASRFLSAGGGDGGSSIAVEAAAPEEACLWEGRGEEELLPVVVTLTPADLDRAGALEPVFECAGRRHLSIVIRIEPPRSWPESADPYAALSPWIESLDRFLQDRHGRIAAFILGRRPDAAFKPSSYAFLAEKVGTLIRSLDSPAPLIASGPGPEAASWFEELPVWRLAPYIQGILLEDSPDRAAWRLRVQSEFPGLPIWFRTEGGATGDALLAGLFEILGEGAGLVVVPAGSPESSSMRTLGNLVRSLPARFVPDQDPLRLSVRGSGGAAPIAHYADPLGPERAVLLPPGAGRMRVTFESGEYAITEGKAVDLGSGRPLPARIREAAGGEGARIDLTGVPSPVLLRFVALHGPRLLPERVGVTAEVELTAEEIIAGLRAFQAGQDRRLQHYTARASLSYHYRADALDESVDVASVNRFYWKDRVGEYEETELYINGARWRGEAPSLPFVQAEKVKEVPLEIRLDASYRYERAGRDTVDGREAYVVDFLPVRRDETLYSGRAWVDKESFAPLRIHRVQRGLKAPITSNSDRIEFGWVQGPEGRHWLPLRGYRQMVFTVLGRSVAVEREALYTEFDINAADFQERRERAWLSDRPILRDDAEGLAYLVRTRDGGRIRQTESLRNVALFAGMRLNSESLLGSPIAGINFFDFDWRGTGTQVDLAFAGVFLNAAWTDPSLAGTPLEFSLEGRFIGVRQEVTRTTDRERRNEEEVEVLREQIFATLGSRLTPLTKAELRTDFTYEDFGPTDRTGVDMVVPSEVLTVTSTARWKYHRSGFLLDLWYAGSRRFGWEDWGLTAGSHGSSEDDFYTRWGAGLAKSFFMGPLYRISFGLGWQDGHDLDRFSRFRIGDFESVRVRGFNGTDLTFDRGINWEVSWLGTLPRSGLSLELEVDGAFMENPEDFTQDDRRFRTGTLRSDFPEVRNDREFLVGGAAGLSFNGPWGSLMRVSVSHRLASSMDLSSRGVGVRITLIKTFDDWPWKRRKGEPESALSP